MPKLGLNTTKRLTLPSGTPEDEAWVDVKTALQLGDIVAIGEATSQTESGLVLLSRLITAWNFTDENGNAVLPTVEWINKLDTVDFIYLSRWADENLSDSLKGLSNDEKKTSSSTSIAATAEAISPPII